MGPCLVGLVWGLTEITLKSALRNAWHVGAHYTFSSFLAPTLGRHGTALHYTGSPSDPKTRVGVGVWASTCSLSDGQILAPPEMD